MVRKLGLLSMLFLSLLSSNAEANMSGGVTAVNVRVVATGQHSVPPPAYYPPPYRPVPAPMPYYGPRPVGGVRVGVSVFVGGRRCGRRVCGRGFRVSVRVRGGRRCGRFC